jgi:hypothetical protein
MAAVVSAAETATEFWTEFTVQVESIRELLASPPADGTQDYILRLKTASAELQHCRPANSTRCLYPFSQLDYF